jgi:hypothetical protein
MDGFPRSNIFDPMCSPPLISNVLTGSGEVNGRGLLNKQKAVMMEGMVSN